MFRIVRFHDRLDGPTDTYRVEELVQPNRTLFDWLFSRPIAPKEWQTAVRIISCYDGTTTEPIEYSGANACERCQQWIAVELRRRLHKNTTAQDSWEEVKGGCSGQNSQSV